MDLISEFIIHLLFILYHIYNIIFKNTSLGHSWVGGYKMRLIYFKRYGGEEQDTNLTRQKYFPIRSYAWISKFAICQSLQCAYINLKLQYPKTYSMYLKLILCTYLVFDLQNTRGQYLINWLSSLSLGFKYIIALVRNSTHRMSPTIAKKSRGNN